MPTSSGSSYLNRLVQNTQAVTRRSQRVAEPTITTIPAEPYSGPSQSPVDVFTSSNALGMFGSDNVPMSSTHRLPEIPHIYDFRNTEPGPSHFYNYSQPGYQTNNYTISAWTKDFTGQDVYVGHGKIEEVGSDAGEGVNHDFPSRSRLGPLLSLNAGGHESNDLLYDDFAYPSTPPPCPRPRRLPSLRPTPTGSDYMDFKATSIPAMQATHGSSLVPILDPTEVHLVRNNLAMVESSLEDVQFMNTVFLSKSVEHDLSEHINLCALIEESLKSLHGTLILRTQIGAEEWGVGSQSWYQKHGNRLYSLKRTLQRLTHLRELMETHSLRSRQRTVLRTKLEQHEAKLADLASKYSAAFDRLKLRHLHFLLKRSHDESDGARERWKLHNPRRVSHESFDRLWTEGKRLRADLRVTFHDQRDCLYNNKTKSQRRSGRQTSAQ